jgi:hypothetical protein
VSEQVSVFFFRQGLKAKAKLGRAQAAFPLPKPHLPQSVFDFCLHAEIEHEEMSLKACGQDPSSWSPARPDGPDIGAPAIS